MRNGKSETGLRACVYKVEVRDNSVWIEPPEEGKNWRLVEFRPVSEGNYSTLIHILLIS